MQVSLSPEPALARFFLLLQDDRIRLASQAVLDLTGFTRNELTSPEFRFEHLFAPGHAPPRALGVHDAILAPLRRASIPARLAIHALPDGSLVALAAEGEEDVSTRAARALAAQTVSRLASVLGDLRGLQWSVEALERAHEEIARGGVEGLLALQDALSRLERDAAWVAARAPRER